MRRLVRRSLKTSRRSSTGTPSLAGGRGSESSFHEATFTGAVPLRQSLVSGGVTVPFRPSHQPPEGDAA